MAFAATFSQQASTRNSASARPFTTARLAPLRPAAVARNVSRQTPLVVCQAAATADKPAEQAAKYHPSPLTQQAPSTYAIIEVGGHQMFVEPGKWYTCNRLKAEVGSKIRFGRVLFMKQDGKVTVGMPYLDKAVVEAEILEELKAPKVIVYKMRPKKHYRRLRGHRQCLTKFMVSKVSM